MKTLTARKFRLGFQELTEQVSVTLNRDGELVTLGTWTPVSFGGNHTVFVERLVGGGVIVTDPVRDLPAAQPTEPTPSVSTPEFRRSAQAQRDAVLRKINKSRDERR